MEARDGYLVHLVQEFRDESPSAQMIVFVKMCKTCETLDVSLLLQTAAEAAEPSQFNTTHTSAAVPESFRDAILSEDDEETCPVPAAVKFVAMDTLKEELDESDDVVSSINMLDSEGRTALDLAALTGQRDMVDLLTSRGGEHKFKGSARMNFVAKTRYSKHQEYLDYLNSTM